MVDRLDAFQRRHTWLGLPIAVAYKLFDDRGPYLAALMTYYGFVSLFPLLLLFFSGLGYFLHGDQGLQQQLAGSALADFPIVGPQLQHNIGSFQGSGTALAVGVAGSLYGGLGIMQAAQAAFNRMYGVPRNEQPNPLTSRLRSLGLLALLGGGVILTTALTVFVGTVRSAGSATVGAGLALLGNLLSYGVNVVLFSVGFQLLTARDLRLRHVLRGGLIAAAAWQLVQVEGTRYLTGRLAHASEIYGSFALVIGLVAYIYVEALVIVVAVEINVVVNHRLWPRALLTPFTDNVDLTETDKRLYAWYARTERYKGFETVHVEFDDRAAAEREDGGAADADSVLES